MEDSVDPPRPPDAKGTVTVEMLTIHPDRVQEECVFCRCLYEEDGGIGDGAAIARADPLVEAATFVPYDNIDDERDIRPAAYRAYIGRFVVLPLCGPHGNTFTNKLTENNNDDDDNKDNEDEDDAWNDEGWTYEGRRWVRTWT